MPSTSSLKVLELSRVFFYPSQARGGRSWPRPGQTLCAPKNGLRQNGGGLWQSPTDQPFWSPTPPAAGPFFCRGLPVASDRAPRRIPIVRHLRTSSSPYHSPCPVLPLLLLVGSSSSPLLHHILPALSSVSSPSSFFSSPLLPPPPPPSPLPSPPQQQQEQKE